MKPTTLDLFARELGYFFEPLGVLASVPFAPDGIEIYDDEANDPMATRPLTFDTAARIEQFLLSAGVDSDTLLPNLTTLVATIEAFGEAWQRVAPLVRTDEPDIAQLGIELRTLGDALRQVEMLNLQGGQDSAADVLRKIFDRLAVLYLSSRRPAIFALLRLLGVVVRNSEDALVLDASALEHLMTDPLSAAKTAHGWGTDDFDPQEALDILYDLAAALEVEVEMTAAPPHQFGGVMPPVSRVTSLIFEVESVPPIPAEGTANRNDMLKLPFGSESDESSTMEIGLALFGLPSVGLQQPGLAATLYGAINVGVEKALANDWRLLLKGALEGEARTALVARPDGVQLEDVEGNALAEFAASLVLRYGGAQDERRGLLDLQAVASVDFQSFDIALALTRDSRGPTIDASLLLQDVTATLETDSADGFLQQILPPDGLSATFQLGVGVHSRDGVYLANGSGLKVEIPLSDDSGGVLSLRALQLHLAPESDRVQLALGITGGMSLGPLNVVVEGVGFTVTVGLDQPEGSGPAHLSLALLPDRRVGLAFGFKPPDGLGLSIDATAVTGGGYLFFDHENERYSGILQLEFGAIAVTAIGLLSTRLPGDREGYSLLLIITAEFPPIQLGFGFTLNGLGGLAGIHRGVEVEVLQEGIKNRTLDSILFPEDPVANAPRILSDLRSVFPSVQDQYTFGPMAIIGWGSPDPLVWLELGVILELPSPVRLVILGQLRVRIPTEEESLVHINMDVLGIVDFAAKKASVDAALYDSRLTYYTLSGEMAMRMRWGDDPTFLMAAGGFNPRFEPPDNFPALERLSIGIEADIARITLKAYFAVTSNTLQFGARLEVYATKFGYEIHGDMYYDVLFYFSPFRFIADIGCGLTVKRRRRNRPPTTVSTIYLQGTLSGPGPWRVRGEATFAGLTVDFDVTMGSATQPELPSIDVWEEELKPALEGKRSWSAQLPADADNMLVTLREVPADAVLAHPLGTLTVHQKAVPLGLEMEKFGEYQIEGAREFDIESAAIGGRQVPPAYLQDDFAPAQYLEMSDSEKLTSPSFEKYRAGAHFVPRGPDGNIITVFSDDLKTNYGYETELIDEPLPEETSAEERERWQPPERHLLNSDVLEAAAFMGPKGHGAQAGPAKFAGKGTKVSVKPVGFAIADANTLQEATGVELNGANAGTYGAVRQALRQHLKEHPADRDRLIIVARHELAEDGNG